jgi:hypothetical protein
MKLLYANVLNAGYYICIHEYNDESHLITWKWGCYQHYWLINKDDLRGHHGLIIK